MKLLGNLKSISPWLIGYLKWVGVITVLLSLPGLKYGFGFLIGSLFFYIYILLKAFYVDTLLFFKHYSLWQFIVFYVLGLGVFVIPLILAGLLPQWFDMICVALGLLGYKYFLFVRQLTKGGEQH